MPDIIEWPREWWGVVTASFGLMPRSQKSQSPWTLKQNIYGPHVQYWSAKLQFPVMTSSELARREAIVEALGGMAGLLRMGHPFRTQPLYNEDVASSQSQWSDGTFFDDGTGWLNGPLPPTINVGEIADHGANSVVVGGLPPLTYRALRRGDLVEFRRNGIATEIPSLHRVKRDASSDSGGLTRIEIVPTLRKGLDEGDQCVLNYPMTVFRLASDDTGMAERNLAHHGTFSMDLIEALV